MKYLVYVHHTPAGNKNRKESIMEEKTNGKEKDRLFCFIFGREENKKWTLSLYNAVNGTDYINTDDIEITTMSDVIYMGMKNDVSFIIGSEISLYEHQSVKL